MDTPTSSSQVPPAMYLATAVALLLAGGIIGAYADPYLPSPLSNTQKGYQSGFAAARKVVEDSSLGNFFRTADDVRQLSGTVTAINGDRITLRLQSVNPFEDPSLNERTILVSTATLVQKQVLKAPALLLSEKENYLKKVKTATSTLEFPIAFTVAPMSSSSIAVGDNVNVTASENIKTAKEFTASEITVLPQAPVN